MLESPGRIASAVCFIALGWLLFPFVAYAQFTTILNIPPDPNIGNNQSIGSSTQVNLGAGGAIGQGFRAGSQAGTSTNVQVNVSGGTVGAVFFAYNGSTINVSGGTFGQGFDAHDGSAVNISGGSVGKDFQARSGSTVNISGGSVGEAFYALDGSTVSISGGAVGTEFTAWGGTDVTISGGAQGDRFKSVIGSAVEIVGGEFRLDGLPISGLEMVGNQLPFNLPIDSQLSGTLADGTPFVVANLETGIDAYGREDSIADGTLTLVVAALPAIGPAMITTPVDPVPLGIRSGQKLVVNAGGTVADSFNAGPGSMVQVNGGQVGGNFEAMGAVVEIQGGSVGGFFDALRGSTVTLASGSLGDGFVASDGSTLNVLDGTVGSGLRTYSGSTLNISGGSLGPGSEIRDSIVNITGGTVGFNSGASGSTLTISGGSIAEGFSVGGSNVTILGGMVEECSASGSTVRIVAGSVGTFEAGSGTNLTISGGSVGNNFSARSGSVVTITGGEVGDNFDADPTSMVNLFGTQFILDGMDITSSLTTNIPMTITIRDVILEGLLADGSPFNFLLASTNGAGDFFDPNAVLTLTRVFPGDFNTDGRVDAADYVVWRNSGGTQQQYEMWRASFGAEAGSGTVVNAAAPEPSSISLVLLAVLSAGYRRSRLAAAAPAAP